MIHIVWEFHVDSTHQREFEQHYSPEGTWVELFRRDPAFQGTTLLRDRQSPERYVTIDCWNDVESYESFRSRHAKDYERIDLEMEKLTSGENRLGIFEICRT